MNYKILSFVLIGVIIILVAVFIFLFRKMNKRVKDNEWEMNKFRPYN